MKPEAQAHYLASQTVSRIQARRDHDRHYAQGVGEQEMVAPEATDLYQKLGRKTDGLAREWSRETLTKVASTDGVHGAKVAAASALTGTDGSQTQALEVCLIQIASGVVGPLGQANPDRLVVEASLSLMREDDGLGVASRAVDWLANSSQSSWVRETATALGRLPVIHDDLQDGLLQLHHRS